MYAAQVQACRCCRRRRRCPAAVLAPPDSFRWSLHHCAPCLQAFAGLAATVILAAVGGTWTVAKKIDGVEVRLGQQISGVEVRLGQKISDMEVSMARFETSTKDSLHELKQLLEQKKT